MGKKMIVWYVHRVHVNGPGDGRTEGNLIFDRWSFKPPHALPLWFQCVKFNAKEMTCLFEDEAPHLAVPFATRPYDENITRFIRTNE